MKITEKSHLTLRAKRATLQKLVKNAKKMVHFGEFLETLSLRSNSVTRQVTFNRTKMVENDKIEKFKCDILGDF